MPGIKRSRVPVCACRCGRRPGSGSEPPTTLPFAVNLLHSVCRQPALLPGPCNLLCGSFFFFFFSHPDEMWEKKQVSQCKSCSLCDRMRDKKIRTMGRTRSEYVPRVFSRGVSHDLLVQIINPLWGRGDTSGKQRDTPKKSERSPFMRS